MVSELQQLGLILCLIEHFLQFVDLLMEFKSLPYLKLAEKYEAHRERRIGRLLNRRGLSVSSHILIFYKNPV
ncbi:hypothetical protein L1987_71286 [Smallanthus sonchifolius]|uniref:Uncharacterized protein n=1 Tax=Smallanthus sonchifolius TaxID=185202 RepID=A0ACB9ATD0_9ASTR|nr:hypothetical protein L1987_71286 [Smallanthus sonchifolius]